MDREFIEKIVDEVVEAWDEGKHPRGKGGKFAKTQEEKDYDVEKKTAEKASSRADKSKDHWAHMAAADAHANAFDAAHKFGNVKAMKHHMSMERKHAAKAKKYL